ncbi:3-dehydroquinate synthase [Caldisphaera lagunensis DSM 15908]|uniref:3-dehydroquinate synthase n=1 Tax=Caldisphaera lagunensis (strain DSM 15908 / JCM 11604 / ANMR 0165 / IC-154) TaxID=1056495 RepID=L0A9S7_CALLD|nr:3-dehydroquinate synthase [Caldisphaera lagunensis]AFZ69897.1 3-dehydroquinate synthase [Caldisphaera lagunensis DSM 15908]
MIYKLNDKEVNIIVGKNLLNSLKIDNNKKYFIIYQDTINDKIKSLISNITHFEIYKVPDREKAKDIEVALDIIKQMVSKEFTRKDAIISFGGGTVSDLSGFVASIFMRGIDLINIPTTLLSMVDASIGGKNGVNFHNIKNVIGTFYQPSMIIIDTSLLDSLPYDEILNGLGEVIKYSIIMDKDLYYYLLNNKEKILKLDDESISYIIRKSIDDKMKIVIRDEKETSGLRTVLNFGHTIGHAIESGSKLKIMHGFAISYGMICETKLGVDLKLISDEIYENVENIINLYDIKINKNEVDLNNALNSLKSDKKRTGNKIIIPLPVDIGKYQLFPIEIEKIEKAIVKCLS